MDEYLKTIKTLAQTIQRLADCQLAAIERQDHVAANAAPSPALEAPPTPEYTMASDRIKAELLQAQFEAKCMDEAGLPSKFKLRCSICGELGRNARTHQDEMRDGTYHWVEVKA